MPDPKWQRRKKCNKKVNGGAGRRTAQRKWAKLESRNSENDNDYIKMTHRHEGVSIDGDER